MSFRGIWIAAIVLVAGCSMFEKKPAEGPERLDAPPEIINVVSEEPPPVEISSQPRNESPRSSAAGAPRAFEEETRTLGNDPRRAAIEGRTVGTSGSPPAVASSPGLVRADNGAPMAPMAGRVGIMSLLGNELQHVQAGTFGSKEQSYNTQYDFNGYVLEELRKALLSKTPYQPVNVASTGALRQSYNTWQDTWDGSAFAPTFQREFDGIIKQNRLAMLIVVSYAKSGDGSLIGGAKLSGSGLYTRGRKAAVFSTLQFYRLVGTPAQLVHPLAPSGERSIGDLPNAQLPKDLDDLPPRYLVPIYEPLRTLVQNKVYGLVSLPRKLGY